ncbi:tetratricopeptide repeat protein [Sphingobacterium sp. LRF_L2]|uniref:tetratricopeptide repeat protein n=1 Tax=Sphingobacterium sp. LRF_L2 TaxID=3369421 RepID=UPI003F627E98
MKIYWYYFLFTSTLFFKNADFLHAQSIAEIKTIKNPLEQIESVLNLPTHFSHDTTLLKKELAPLKALAKQNKSIPLEWAYYMLMADGYSIAFDHTNAISDQYYKYAALLIEAHPNTELEMIGNIRQGYYNFVYRKVIDAFPYFLRANDLDSKIDRKKIPLPVKHYQFMASFFNHIGDQKKAIHYLHEALPFAKPASRARIDLINSIAVYLSVDSLVPEALKYLKQAMNEAQQAKDSVWIGIISGNMADYTWKEGDKQKAIELVKKNIDLSIRYDEPNDAMRANLVLASWYIDQQEWQHARKHVQASEYLMKDKPYFLKYKMDAAKLLASISHGLGQQDEQLRYLNRYILMRDSLEKRTNIKELQKIIWESEQEKYDRTLLSEAEKRQKVKSTYQFMSLLLVLIFAIVILLINRSKANIKIRNATLEKEQLQLNHKKQLVDQELLILKNSLSEFTDTVKQNDITIQQLREELEKEENQNPTYIAEVKANLNALMETHIMTDDRWARFRHAFDLVYPNYLQQMKDEHAKITENDLRILALQKLELSNASMSELLCISIEGIKKAKQRLKKKLDSPYSS